MASLLQTEAVALNVGYISSGTVIAIADEEILVSSLAKMGVDKGPSLVIHTTGFLYVLLFCIMCCIVLSVVPLYACGACECVRVMLLIAPLGTLI